MNKKAHSFWMISPKSFISLLGAEYQIMREAGGNVLKRFYLASVAVVIVVIVTFLSIRYAIELLFHIPLVEIVLSLFISLLFCVLYIFLINTFSKRPISGQITDETLNEEKNEADATTEESKGSIAKLPFNRDILTLTNISRTGFIIFMGFILSKPLEIFFVRDTLDDKVELYKKQLIESHREMVTTLYSTEFNKISREIEQKKLLNRYHEYDQEMAQLRESQQALSEKQESILQNANDRIERNSFFIYRVRLTVSHYSIAWFICFMVLILFLLPGYLIYSISHQEEYYKMKIAMEREIIEKSWKQFNDQYSSFFEKKYGYKTSFFSVYEDAPFNTIRKSIPPYKSQEDFFDRWGKQQ